MNGYTLDGGRGGGTKTGNGWSIYKVGLEGYEAVFVVTRAEE
jgi:hypothetical protein